MQVETYEVEEAGTASGTTPEIEVEANRLIDALDLDGQKTLRVDRDGTPERVQFAAMTRAERHVYAELFPSKTNLRQYASGPVPVRVLQLAERCVGHFVELQVWHKDVRDPDPLLVGKRKAQPSAETGWSSEQLFLLARWGDALKTFAELTAEALASATRRMTGSIRGSITHFKGLLEDVDNLAARYVAGENVGV